MNDTTNTLPTELIPPALPPPDPNLPHDSLKTNIIVSAAVCWFIALFFVILRFYTRGVIIRVLGGSDWAILVALIFSGATCGAVIEQATVGSGQHIYDLNPSDQKSAIAWGRSAWYGILFYTLTLLTSKISILLLYIHLFTLRWARLAGQSLLGIVVLSHLYMILVTFTACIPLVSYWDFRVTKKYCHPQAVWWSNTALHMITDFFIFMLPMPVVWGIQVARRQKLVLMGVFGFGFLVCFISILRLIQLLRAQTNQDFTYGAAELSYLTAVEVNGAIVVACVMTLKPFVVRFFPGLLSGSSLRGIRSTEDSGIRRRRRNRTRSISPDVYGMASDTLPRKVGGGTGPVSSVLDKQYGIHRDEYRVGGGYVQIDDDKMPGVNVEMKNGLSAATAAQQARRDYMSRRGGGGPVPEGVVRVETSVTIIKEEKR
ncbi:hypothetical protein QBC38DRAFT_487658 [Podospora fimiseda]|uniref:Rhodopsin domain-containing protein n=1 Tax=Podospora fimiseda TaxID=252190 RepID=A0AAN7BHR7_9PEZI|nr:hypothetical protein QBC38DRAFT_487658 [Podospora fimiseda]